MLRTRILALMLIGLPFVGGQVLSAQTTGSISGSVKDETGGVLPGASISVTNTDTGISREAVSDHDGRYRVTNLQIGQYEVSATMSGFRTMTRSGIVLTIGRDAGVDFSMNIGGLAEDVTVSGDAALVDTRSGTLGTIVDRDTILEIPLQGRDLTGLITMQAGVTNAGQASGASNGWSNKFSIGGARPNDNAVLLDGTEVRAFDQGVPAGVSGNFLGGEAIQEFKVEKNAYSAEFGGATGGVINVVSKAGGNAFHGSVYGFGRNAALDATGFRAPLIHDANGNFIGQEKPDFWRAQYGASAGGRIIRNRMFYYANWEGLRERLGSSPQIRVLTAEARRGIFPDRIVQVKPSVAPYLALWPLPGPNAEFLGDGTARERHNRMTPTDEDFYQLRVDHNISNSDAVFGRVTRQASTKNTQESIPIWSLEERVYNTFVTGEYRKILTSRLLNTFRFGYNRRGTASEAFEEPGAVDPALFLVPPDKWLFPMGAPPIMGSLGVTDLTGVGLGRGWVDRNVNRFQVTSTGIYNLGKNTLKFGVDVTHLRMGGDNPSRPGGELSFPSIDAFLQGRPTSFRGDILPATDFNRNLRWNTFGSYMQYDWQFHSRATVNLGVRHDFYTVPTERDGKIASMLDPMHDSTYSVLGTNGDTWWENPSFLNFSPRTGISWDPTGSGRTAVRAGVGLFHNLLQPEVFRQAAYRTAPFGLESNISAVEGVIPFPEVYDYIIALGQAQADFFPFAYYKDDVGNPRMWQWNLNVQREVMANTSVTVGYAGSRGLQTTDRWNLNTAVAEIINGRYVFPANAPRPNPNFNLDLQSNTNSGGSWYNSLQVEARRRFAAGWQVQLAYTRSKAMDLISSAGPGVSMYVWNKNLSRGLADFHNEQRLTGSFVWQLPGGGGQGLVNAIVGGWQLGGILDFSSGSPSSISMSSRPALAAIGLGASRPDLIPGGDNNPILGGPDLYFDPTQFALPPTPRTIGNVGRNTLIGPGLATLDLGLTKNVRFGDQSKVQIRLEAFNALNRANLGGPSTNVMNATGRPNATAGYIGGTSTRARAVQLGLRLDW